MIVFTITPLQFPVFTDILKTHISDAQRVGNRVGTPLILENWSAVGHIMGHNSFMTFTFFFKGWEEYPLPLLVPFTGSKVLNLTSDTAKDAIGITDKIMEELTDLAYSLLDQIEKSKKFKKLVSASVSADDEETSKLFQTAARSTTFMDALFKNLGASQA